MRLRHRWHSATGFTVLMAVLTVSACSDGDSSRSRSGSANTGAQSTVTVSPSSDIGGADGGPEAGPVEQQPVNPSDIDGFDDYQAPSTDEGSAAFQASVNAPTPEQAAAYLTTVMKDTDTYWTEWFKKARGQETFWFYRIATPQQSWTSRCMKDAVVHNFQNAFYCPTDEIEENGVTYEGGVYLPLTTFMNMWSGQIFNSPRSPNFKGDFAAAVIAAHERAHEVQHKIRKQFNLPDIVLYQNGKVVIDPKTNAPAKIKQKELIADCFAGNWTNSAYYKNQLSDTDVYEAMSALAAIGDFTTNGKDPHGTQVERMAAFKLGYDTGDPSKCITTYWVTVDWSRTR